MGIAERRQREFQRREKEVLEAALSLFNSDQWQSVTVEQIAEQAEIGKGTVYKHFDSKDEIYAQLTLDFHRMLLQNLRKIDGGLDVIGRMRAVIRCIWDTHLEQPDYHRILEFTRRADFQRNLTPRMREEFDALNAELMEVYLGVLRDGVQQGIFPDRPLPQLMQGAAATVDGALLRLWSGCLEGQAADEYIEQLTDFIQAGLIHQHLASEEQRVA